MRDARRLQTLYTRRRRLNLALADMGRRADRIRATIAEVEDELATMVLFVAPLKPRAPATVLTRDLLDLLRSGEAMTTRQITLGVMEQKGLEMPEPRVSRRYQNRVWAALARLQRRGLVRGEAESRRVVRWRLDKFLS